MIVKANPVSLDVWELFVHGSDARGRPYDPCVLAEALNRRAEDWTEFERVVFSSTEHCGLDRWLLEWKEWDVPEGGINERIRSVAQARALLPANLVARLDELNKAVVYLLEG
jgi:hypothetical protein